MIHLGDITKINGYTAPVVDVVVGGSPCQDLSVAGKRAGLDGERSGLFMEQIRIVKEMRKQDELRGRTGVDIRPRYMLWENVPGAFSSNSAEDFRIVLEETAKVAEKNAVIPMPPTGKWTNAGCIMGDGWSIAWRVCDAQFWGVPQRRRRIALVADFGGQSAPEILFVRKGVSGHTEPSEPKRKEVACDATGGFGANDCYTFEPGIASREGGHIYENVSGTLRANAGDNQMATAYSVENHPADSRVDIDESGKVQTLTSRMGTGGGNVPMVMQCFSKSKRAQSATDNETWVESDTANTINAFDVGDVRATDVVLMEAYQHHGYRESDVSNTLTAGQNNGVRGDTPLVIGTYQDKVGSLCARDYKGVGSQYVNEDKLVVAKGLSAVCYGIGNGQVDGTGLHDKVGTLNCMHDQQAVLTMEQTGKRIRYIVRRLTPLECERLQGFPDFWTRLDPIDDMSEEDYEFWKAVHFQSNVRKTRIRVNENGEWEIWKRVNAESDEADSDEENEECEIEEVWENTHKLYKHKSKAQMVKWYNKLIDSESARYKALGNSIALPSWKWVLKRLSSCYERDATMASLFDGIGGFPYLWEQLNGKGSCLWASEIDEFPMAVTKVRLGE